MRGCQMWLNPPSPPSHSLMWLTQFFLHSLRPTNQSCCEFSKLLECTRFDLKLNNSLTFALNQCNNYHGRAYPRSQAIFFTDKICPKLGDDAKQLQQWTAVSTTILSDTSTDFAATTFSPLCQLGNVDCAALEALLQVAIGCYGIDCVE